MLTRAHMYCLTKLFLGRPTIHIYWTQIGTVNHRTEVQLGSVTGVTYRSRSDSETAACILRPGVKEYQSHTAQQTTQQDLLGKTQRVVASALVRRCRELSRRKAYGMGFSRVEISGVRIGRDWCIFKTRNWAQTFYPIGKGLLRRRRNSSKTAASSKPNLAWWQLIKLGTRNTLHSLQAAQQARECSF